MHETEKAPEQKPTPTPEQKYTTLCALIGERHQWIRRLNAEIEALSKELEGVKLTPPPAQEPTP